MASSPYQCTERHSGCQFSGSTYDQKTEHENYCRFIFFKLFKEYHDLSYDVKWLSLIRDYQNRKFYYKKKRYIYSNYEIIYTTFENSPEYDEFNAVVGSRQNSQCILRCSYIFVVVETVPGSRYILCRGRDFRQLENGTLFESNYETYPTEEKYGSLNDICNGDIIIFGDTPVSSKNALSSIAELAKKLGRFKEDQITIGKEIKDRLAYFLKPYLPNVLTSIVVEYYWTELI